MATLSTTLPTTGGTAIIIPNKPNALTITYSKLTSHVSAFQQKLAQLGIHPQAAVSIALPNSYEFIVAFLAASWQRAIAAPLNPGYKQDEFEFYIDDLSSAVTLVPQHSFRQDGPAVRAARNHQAAIAECYWNGHEVALDIKEEGKLSGKGGQAVQRPQPDDIALVLHTSGTTGRPKAVRSWSTPRNRSRGLQANGPLGASDASESDKDNECVTCCFNLHNTKWYRKYSAHLQTDFG